MPKSFADAIGTVAVQCCDVAQHFGARVDRKPALAAEHRVPRYIAESSDAHRLNDAIVADVREAGIAAPSTTVIGGRLAIGAAIVNHRRRSTSIGW
jgi:aromatic-L-amino-acid decarboxylase